MAGVMGIRKFAREQQPGKITERVYAPSPELVQLNDLSMSGFDPVMDLPRAIELAQEIERPAGEPLAPQRPSTPRELTIPASRPAPVAQQMPENVSRALWEIYNRTENPADFVRADEAMMRERMPAKDGGKTAQGRKRETVQSIGKEPEQADGEGWQKALAYLRQYPIRPGEAELRPYNPAPRDMIGGMIAGDDPRSPAGVIRGRLADALVGSTGLEGSGTIGFGALDVAPRVGAALQVGDVGKAMQDEDYLTAGAMAALPAAFAARRQIADAGRRALEVARQYAPQGGATAAVGATMMPQEAEAGGGSVIRRALQLAEDIGRLRRPGSGYEPIPGAPATVNIPGIGKVEARPIPELEQAASNYMRSVGRPNEHAIERFVPLNEDYSRRVAQAFEEMKHDPTSPPVRRAFDALADETLAQYRAAKEAGIDVRFLKPGEADPYAASPALGYEDIMNRGRLFVFPTDQGFGSTEALRSTSPMLRGAGRIGNKPDALVNDAFRVVHDLYGHFGPGNPFFRAPGEERAYQLHSRMYSPEARPAAAAETRGQNSWVNFGPHGERNRVASGADTIYADQKTGLLPDWAMELPPEYAEGGEVQGYDKGGMIKRAMQLARQYTDPKTTKIEDWKWRPLSNVQKDLNLTEIPPHVQGFGDYMREVSEKAAKEGLSADDLIRAFTTTRASIQRQAVDADKVRAAGLPIEVEGKIRPEGAWAEWLMTPMGRKYVGEAARGDVSGDTVAQAVRIMAPFGKHETDIPDAMKWAAQNLPGREKAASDLVARGAQMASDPSEWREFTRDVRGIGPSKSGFIASLLGRGDLPTLDARQIILHTGEPSKAATPFIRRGGGLGGQEGVDRLAARQAEMALETPEQYKPFYQHLAHHAVWDKAGNDVTTHDDVMRAMRSGFDDGGTVEEKPSIVDRALSILSQLNPIGSAEAAPVKSIVRGAAKAIKGAGDTPTVAREPLFDYSSLGNVPHVRQFDLPRYEPARGVPERTQAIVSDPNVREQMLRTIEEGEKLGGSRWYNADPLREVFVREYGRERGDEAFRKYMDLVAATSPRSEVGANARNASYYFHRAMTGQGMPEVGERNPQPYGHMAQRLHQMNAQRVAGAGWDPLNNPKPASFVENLVGNQQPVTVDTHAFRLPAIIARDPRFLETAFQVDKTAPKQNIGQMVARGELPIEEAARRPAYWQAQPKENEYAAMERYYKSLGQDLGLTPAQTQAAAWVGGGKLTGLKSDESKPFLQFFEDRVYKTAIEKNMEPQDVLKAFVRGQMPLYASGGSVAASAVDTAKRVAKKSAKMKEVA